MNKPMLLVLGSGPRGVDLGGNIGDHFNLHLLDADERAKPDTVADIQNLPFEDESFDAVCAHHVLEHVTVEGIISSLKEAYRVLKPGGELFIGVPNLTYACEKVLEGKALETVYVTPVGKVRLPITAMDMIYGWSIAIKSAGPQWMMHRYGFTRETLYGWLTNDSMNFKWSLVLSFEMRLSSEYDRCEVRAYGIKHVKQDEWPYKYYSQWPRDISLTAGDPFIMKGGSHVSRYKKKEEEEDGRQRTDLPGSTSL
jgi:predicted SAM-dependent methyltransferase